MYLITVSASRLFGVEVGVGVVFRGLIEVAARKCRLSEETLKLTSAAALPGRIYDQRARMRSMSGRIRSRATSRGTPDISRES